VIKDSQLLLERLRNAHAAIRDAVLAACEQQAMETLAAPVADEPGAGGGGGGGDTIFALDRISEATLVAQFEQLAHTWPCVLIAEGLSDGGRVVLPRGGSADDTELTIIVDPIDGTRGLMYQKRPAWILTGVACSRSDGMPLHLTLADIELALQTEIPLLKQHLSDALWVVDGVAGGERYNRFTRERSALVPHPSRAETLAQGYGGLARFFPGARDVLAGIDDTVVTRVAGTPQPGRALAFEDQYISTGGQLYELMMGHDRWIADLRPLVEAQLRARGLGLGLCCHPYDLCTESIARAAGVVVTDEHGNQLAAPLDVTSDVAWIGFANGALRQRVFPVLREVLEERGLVAAGDDGDSPPPPPDLFRFEQTVEAHTRGGFFDRDETVVITRAPGRLDVMGGIADYSGALVLELPLAAATFAAAQLTHDRDLCLRTLCARELGEDVDETVTIPIDALFPGGKPVDYPTARALLTGDPRRRWAAYVGGSLVVLAREHGGGASIARGMRLLIDSSVPPGKGVGSSAALEVAAMQAIGALCEVHIDARDLALACQRVENLVVGAPCGVMDQMTSACGESGRLLALECQPAELRGHTRVPAELELWGIDSGVRHEVGGADYGDVRVAAFMGYRIIADLAALPVQQDGDGCVRIDDNRWRGFLANVTPSEWERAYRDQVPSTIDGRSFLDRYGGITDPTTSVDPQCIYAVRQATAHPIYENHRVHLFRAVLERGGGGGGGGGAHTESDRCLLGELMYQSHASYGACGLGSNGTDRLVELVRAAGTEGGGLYGAKITGGGSGGVVAVLARAGSRSAVEDIARRYASDTGYAARVLGGSSPGAAVFGVRRHAWV
jgi:galactokinase